MRLGLNPESEFVIYTNDDLIKTVEKPFSLGSNATVFHVHEVMRIALTKVVLTEKEGFDMAHSNGVRAEFEALSYHASCVWKNWEQATNDAGGAIRTILQRMFGVRIRQNGWWIPHLMHRYIEVDETWSIIDDVVPTETILDLELLNSDDIWISMETGLRLINNKIKPTDCSEDLSDFFGLGDRFPSATSWLKWCLMNGSERELPDRPGAKVFYFNGIIDDEVPRYYHSKVRKNGPFSSEWWSKDANSEDVPKFEIEGRIWTLGVMWEKNPDLDIWEPSYPHFSLIQENKIVDISREGLRLDVFKDIESDDDDHLRGFDEKRSLNNALLTEHLRAVRVLLVELGYATSPTPEDKFIGGLGLSGSKIQSPFSDIYFLNSNKRSPLGVAINSPIETTIRRQILRNNWYVVK